MSRKREKRTVGRSRADQTVAYTAENEGGIEKRTYPTGRVQFYVSVRQGGQQRNLRVPGPQTWTNARQFRTTALHQIDNGDWLEPKKLKTRFGEFAQIWLDGLEVRPQTRGVYERYLTLHILPQIAQLPMQDITMERIQQLKLQVLEDLSPSTVRLLLACLRRILNVATDWGYIRSNPATKIQYPRLDPRTNMTLYDAVQIRLLLQHATAHWRVMFQMALTTGMRIGELIAAKWEYLDDQEGLYRVTENWSQQTLAFGPPKTSASAASVDIDERMMEALRQHRARVAEMSLKAPDWVDVGLIFPTRNGKTKEPSFGVCGASQRR
jgi:integrase